MKLWSTVSKAILKLVNTALTLQPDLKFSKIYEIVDFPGLNPCYSSIIIWFRLFLIHECSIDSNRLEMWGRIDKGM